MNRVKNQSPEEKLKIYPECHWCAENVGRIALWGNIGLFAIKIFCALAGNSKALLADAVHSAVDVLTAAIVWISLRVSRSHPDEEHPYGHGNIEYISSLFIGISLMAVVVLIISHSTIDIINGVTHEPGLIAILGLIISILGNELMFRHSYCCGTRFGSPAMIANAWENRADVYSSIAALVGVIGAKLGFLAMDPLGAILVALVIGRSSFEMLRDAWRGILDHSAEGSIENLICKEAEADPDILGVPLLITRAIGPHLAVDMKLGVSPEMTLREGYKIADRMTEILIKKIDKLALINVSPTGLKSNDIS